jgi:hypothetical protein
MVPLTIIYKKGDKRKMEKPISMILSESKQTIINAVASTNLHPALLELIIKDIYNEVKLSAERQLEMEQGEYNYSLQEKGEQE